MQSFSSTSIYRTGLQKLSIYGHFQQHLYCTCAGTVIYELPCKFTHRRSIRRPRFPIRVQNFSNSATFFRSFLHFICWMSAIFLLPVFWPTDLESIPHASTPMSIIPTRSEVDMIIHCRVVAFLSADMSRDLWPVTLTFDLLTLNTSHMAGHVINLATLPIRCWVMSYNVSHWLPLKMRTRPLSMRRITWPVSRESKTITYLESPTPIWLSLCNFYWATTTIKGRLLSSRPMLAIFWRKNSKCRRNGAQKWRFWGKMGV